MLREAAVGYWASVTPLQLPADLSTIDPAQLVISLRIGDNGQGAPLPSRRLAVLRLKVIGSYLPTLLPQGGGWVVQACWTIFNGICLACCGLHTWNTWPNVGDSISVGASKRARLSAAPDTYVSDLLLKSAVFAGRQLQGGWGREQRTW
mgnify:CR=1 FL=1